MAETELTTETGDDDVEVLYQRVMTCEPFIDGDDVSGLEKWFAKKNTGVIRRCGLALATQDGAFFKRVAEERDTAEAVAELLGPLDEHIEVLEETVRTLRAASTRALVALCNQEDFDVATKSWAAPAPSPA
ncbi:MAG: hypothetical protein EOP50_00775 [Sphingobacteriales bacterium]|nr:MAG: hypothetical protein EOP50_00775 [Sphingobacteriales bacterium]